MQVLYSDAAEEALRKEELATGWGAQEFNAALLVLLPKEEPAYGRADVRRGGRMPVEQSQHGQPVAVAQAVRLRAELVLARGVSSVQRARPQRGLLPGRSMLEDVAEVDAAMQTASRSAEAGGAVFFDFAAAFLGAFCEIAPGPGVDLIWPELAPKRPALA